MLLAGVSEFPVAMDTKFIVDNWRHRDSFVAMETGSPLVQLLAIIGNQAKQLGKIALQDVKGTVYISNYMFAICTCYTL